MSGDGEVSEASGGEETDAGDGRETPPNLDVPEDLTLALIAAVAENRVIGREGEMPWHYPADLQHFKETTTGHPVIMGRRTYESIVDALGEPLPERTTVVLSRSALDLPENAVQATDLQEAVETAAAAADDMGVDTVYVAGGGTVYEAFLPVADRLVLTEIHETVAGDTRFPAFAEDEWTETARDDREELSFVTYERA
ncbi:dihydrofolate reductase [Haloparvum sp. PAK95]|uniref:dihydrofolate reductase n=1 Tax=Haloparvum sp. PAK95 TaxID=3418962 RepID=UPI003D2ECA59